MFHVGDRVIYRMRKYTTHPGPRARNVAPAPHGDFYDYEVDKFWVVAEQLNDGRLLLRTRRGKEHVVPLDDPKLRRAQLWERWLYRQRFSNQDE